MGWAGLGRCARRPAAHAASATSAAPAAKVLAYAPAPPPKQTTDQGAGEEGMLQRAVRDVFAGAAALRAEADVELTVTFVEVG